MPFNNPFDEDTSYYKQLIEEDSKPEQTELDNGIEDAEIISDDEIENTVNGFLDSNTSKGLPASAIQAIQEAKKRASLSKQQQKQLSCMFEKLFDDLNKKYGLDIHIDFNSFSKSLEYIIEPTNKRALELFLSEGYSRFRVVLYTQYLQAISLLSAQILDPNYLLSDSMTQNEKLQTMKQLYEFMQTMNEIYERVNIPDTEMKLEKISEDKHGSNLSLNNSELRDLLDSIKDEVKNKSSEVKQ